MTNQDDIFFEKEGDAWFRRNVDSLGKNLQEDFPLRIMDFLDLRPSRVLEVGAANGYRLAEISRRLGAGEFVAIEPSAEAIKDGQKRYPFIHFRRGLMSELPLQDGETFDLVIVNFVFHWVTRNHLICSVSEIDRAIVDGGYLIISDFLPDVPTKVEYHHLPDEEVYTYKQDYAEIFLSSRLYNLIARFIFDHDNHRLSPDVVSDRRGVCSCLRKNQEGLYVTKAFQKNC